ncbi:Karyopherin transporter [Podospora pseudopauciseta]|uniref:Karyopherin transporter n=1 Tax=Podospora pseudopauciseta TaxID=2093780 RepID=A0ABR0HH95_9PEZI|nr:Karyopherin transporter [Podospora pseudopauciseta]
MPVSIEELDATVRAFYEGRGEQFKEDSDAWLMVDDILSKASYEQTKCWFPILIRAQRGWV